MKPTPRLALLAALVLLPSAAFPQNADPTQPSVNIISMFGDGIVFNLPAGWKRANQQRNDNIAIVEYLPEGQTLKAWREMVTVQAFRNPPAQVTPKSFMEIMAGKVKEQCGAQAVATPLADLKVDGQPAFSAIVGCASFSNPVGGAEAGQGEVAYYLAVRGTKDMLLFQRAVRGPGFDKTKPPITPANAGVLHDAFLPIKICSLAEPAAACAKRNPR